MNTKIFPLILGLIFVVNSITSQVSFHLPATICLQDSVNLTANTGSLTNCTYTWSGFPFGVMFSNPSSSVTTISITNAGSYSISLKVKSGNVTDSITHYISVLSLPNISLSQSSSTTCIESNFLLFSKPIHLTASGGVSYTWNPAPSMAGAPNGSQHDVRPTVNSCFTVTGIDTNGCRAKASVCATVIPRFNISVAPTTTSICKSNDPGAVDVLALLTMGNPTFPAFGTSSSHGYTWTAPSGGLGILTNPFSSGVYVSPNTTTTFTAEIKDSLGCISLPAYSAVNVQTCTGVSSENFTLNFKVYPNPANQYLYIETGNEVAKLHVSNMIGQQIYSTDIEWRKELNLELLPSGFYFINISRGTEQRTFKILKQ